MKKTTITLIFYLLLAHFNVALGQNKWLTHSENEQVKIEYRIADCKDRVNDTDFSFYVLRFKNKTKKQLNVQFDNVKKLGESNVRDENFYSFILKPSEIREGNCNSQEKELRQFFKENKDSKEISMEKPLLILNVKTYEM